jgi:hypothetical protein
MPIVIGRIQYFTPKDVQVDLHVSRQSLWRWRRAKKVPQGRKYRDRQVVFTLSEFETIRQYANRLVPAEPTTRRQAQGWKLPTRSNKE